MADVVLRRPAAADVGTLVAHMRKADVDEVHAAGHDDLRAVVAEGVRVSVDCHAAWVDDELACIFGVAPLGGRLLSPIGVPWLLGTDTLLKHRRTFVRLYQPHIARMLGLYPHLLNFVHAENAAAIRWLSGAGFSLAPAAPYGPRGAMFHRFEMSNV